MQSQLREVKKEGYSKMHQAQQENKRILSFVREKEQELIKEKQKHLKAQEKQVDKENQ